LDHDLSEAHRARREQLLEEIYRVFADVDRVDGISWSESRVVDDNGSESERASARSKDVESGWQELVDDHSWTSEVGVGGWNFLDAIGFRYYLPAAMVRCVRSGYDQGIEFQFELPKFWLRKYTLGKWSALNIEQQVCVKHFLQFMAAVSGDERWERSLRSHWAAVDGNPDTERCP